MNSIPAPFIGSIKKVEDSWIDYNGHFNMAYYAVLFDRTCDEAFAELGLGPDYLASGCSFFTLEAHVSYLRELHAGDAVKVTLQILDYDDKRVHYVQEMFHEAEGWLSATMEAICMHVDMNAKKAAIWPEDIKSKIAAMYEDHRDVPIPQQVGHKIGIKRKIA